MGGKQPLKQRDMAALVQGADADRELLAALIAVIPAGAHGAFGGHG